MQPNSKGADAREGFIEVRGACEHNLKNVDIDIPRGKLAVFTGKSGSGKSSLAFDTIYAEAYRKYMESLSADARGLLSQIDKPAVKSVSGLSPVIAIEQRKSLGSNPRSTLATLTEIADYARAVWCAVGEQRCPKCGGKIMSRSADDCVAEILALPPDSRVHILAPCARGKASALKQKLKLLRQRSWQRARIGEKIFDIDDAEAEAKALSEIGAGKTATLEIVVDRFPLSSVSRGRIADSLELALREGEDKAVAAYSYTSEDGSQKSGELFLSSAFSCQKCGAAYGPISARSFSFNHPDGACALCGGIGKIMRAAEQLAVPDPEKSVRSGSIKAWRIGAKNIIIQHNAMLRQLAEQIPFDPSVPWKDLPGEVRRILLYGDDKRLFTFRLRRRRRASEPEHFAGVLAEVDRICAETSSDGLRARLAAFQVSSKCPECGGARLNARSRNVFVAGESYDSFLSMPVGRAREFAEKLAADPRCQSASEAVKGLLERLNFLCEVGLDYISLDREASTLSGGEAQRARLATQLGMDLTGVTYVLDEPTIGLHPSDNNMLLNALKKLRDRGNSVLMVEHDEAAIRSCDWIVEMGPEAGERGGEVTFCGSLEDCLKSDCRTGQYLSGRAAIRRSSPPLAPDLRRLTVKKARANNLKNVDVSFPVGLFTTLCGVSGSGKSTLLNDILAKGARFKLNGAKEIPAPHGGIDGLEYFDSCVLVDQSPIGKSPRSNPATYTKLFDLLRELYSQCPLAKMRGYTPGRFSFNVKGGRCERCMGDGYICLDMQFLGEVYVCCPSCGGRRYNRETLEVRFKDLSISDVLNMTVTEAMNVFSAHPRIMSKLQTLDDVGLGYIRLGQAANTLSGGEAQRMKLSLELSRRSTGKTLYILDEPTTGLHWDDVDKLLKLLFKLRDAGNTIIAIEHNPDFIRMSDWLVELGPGGGEAGGRLIFEGSFDELCKAQTPTAKYLENPAASRAAPAPSARAPKASKAPKAAKTDEKNSDKKR